MSWSGYGTYLAFVVLLVLAPGPDTIVVLKNSLRGGRAAGTLTTTGIAMAGLAQGTAVALGVGALITRAQPVFEAIRLAGVVYLCWLGAQALRAAWRDRDSVELSDHPESPRQGFRCWRQGFLSNVTNPKVLALYLSILPQFMNRGGHGSLFTALLLAYTVPLLGSVWQLSIVILLHRVRGWLRHRRVRRTLDAATGSVLVGFGIALAAEGH